MTLPVTVRSMSTSSARNQANRRLRVLQKNLHSSPGPRSTMADIIISKLSTSFQHANAAGDLLFFPSTVHKHEESGVQFEIRLCPALQNKPKLPTPHFIPADRGGADASAKGKPDPFAPPYIPNLLIGELTDPEENVFVILLNKYSVVASHFLLVTKEYQSQASPLLPSELAQAYLLLLAAREAGQNFFAFYNCGDLSGASQPHKHLQFIPVEQGGPPVEKLAKACHVDTPDKPFSIEKLPYANHVRRLPQFTPPTSREDLEEALGQAYISLLDLVISTIRHDVSYPSSRPSYNVFMTLEHLHLIPRRQEEHVLVETGEKLSINSLGFAGMLLVKSERELEAVKKEGVRALLMDVGMKSVLDQQLYDPHQTDADGSDLPN